MRASELRLFALSLLLFLPAAAAAGADRKIAFTFDDLPGLHASGGGHCDVPAFRRLNTALVAAIRRNRLPALGLVVETRLCEKRRGELAPLLRTWLDAGLELGNHTASHYDLTTTALDVYQNDLIAGEATLRPLLKEYGKTPRYFRYPYLRSGADLGKKRAFERFLRDRGYVNAPVTLDNDDYIYADAYGKALRRGDRRLADRLATDYLDYLDTMAAFYEKLSRDTLGYELPQILLLHGNQLNADQLDRVVARFRARGYRFISVEEALKDPAYRAADAYVGRRGLSWLHRWALDRGKNPSEHPGVPTWVNQAR